MSQEVDERFMHRALELAKHAQSIGEVPVGAVIVDENGVLGEGYNCPISSTDGTAHAEINALRKAFESANNYRLPNTTLYTTLEPCPMCAGAIIHARVQRVVIAAKEPRAGAAGSVVDLLNNEKLNHRCKVEIGLLAEESGLMLKAFFKQRRAKV